MKRSLALVICLLAASSAFAATRHTVAPVSTPVKIAVINFQQAVSATNEGQQGIVDLQKKFDPKRLEITTQSDKLSALKKQLQDDSAKLTPEERQARQKAIDDLTKERQTNIDSAENEFRDALNNQFQALAKKVYAVLDKFATTGKYTLIIDIGTQQSPVLWASGSTNITKAVVDAYNVKSKVPPPPAAPTPKK